MRSVYLKDCGPGDVVEDVFVITNKQLAAASNGKPYIKAFISDKSGPVTARMWNASRDIFNALPEAGFLRVRARIENCPVAQVTATSETFVLATLPLPRATVQVCDGDVG